MLTALTYRVAGGGGYELPMGLPSPAATRVVASVIAGDGGELEVEGHSINAAMNCRIHG
jgi:hypothetical protein